MHLREYLFKNRMKKVDFANLIKYSDYYVAAIAEGKVKPGRKFAAAVEEYTKGEVTAKECLEYYDFFQQEMSKKKKRK